MVLKQKFSDGELNPWEFLKAIRHTIGCLNTNDSVISSSDSEHSDDEVDDIPREGNKCVVCFAIRTSTWILMPCQHANCCESCRQNIQDFGQCCPVCRANIENMFPIFINPKYSLSFLYILLLY